MSQKDIEQEYQAILDLLSKFDAAVSIDEIYENLPLKISRRTLQRRLAALIDAEKIIAQGKKRGRRYLIEAQQALTEIPKEESGYIPLSTEAQEVKGYARRPLTQRRSVTYNRQFLDSYKPNQTQYLPETIKQHLYTLSKNHNGDRPAGTFARQIYDRLLIDLSWNSSRLEGNTYSLLETEKLINFGKAIEGKDRVETKMILNHKAAIEFLIDSVDYIGINSYTILNIHALLSDELLGNPESSGRLRAIAVGIGSSAYNPPEIPQLIAECFNQLLVTAAAINDPFEQSFFVMVHLPYLQPFEDVNKRVSRLAANIPLIINNLSPISFVEVPERAYIDGIIGVYELNNIKLLQDVYVWAYERSCYRYGMVRDKLVEPDPFRLQYSKMVSEVVRKIVLEQQSQQVAFALIRDWAQQQVPKYDQVRFVEMVETELTRLHEGNIARHKLLPHEFTAWQKKWH